MKRFVEKYWLIIVGVALGALAGYLYWQQVGCSSGNCAITSNPINSTLYGSVVGGLAFSLFTKKNK